MPAVNTFAPRTDDPQVSEDLYLPVKRPKRDTRSKLARSYEAAGGRIGSALVVNACPWRSEPDGCADEDLDANGYCKHLVGTTPPGEQTQFHPRVKRTGKLSEFEYTATNLLPVQPGDELVRDTTCYRVYRRSGLASPPDKKGKKDEPTE